MNMLGVPKYTVNIEQGLGKKSFYSLAIFLILSAGV
jgi:hypothetical protein